MPETFQKELQTQLHVKADNYTVSLFFLHNVSRTAGSLKHTEQVATLYNKVVEYFSFYHFIYINNFDISPFIGLALKHPNISTFKQLNDRNSTLALLPPGCDASSFLDALFNAVLVLVCFYVAFFCHI